MNKQSNETIILLSASIDLFEQGLQLYCFQDVIKILMNTFTDVIRLNTELSLLMKMLVLSCQWKKHNQSNNSRLILVHVLFAKGNSIAGYTMHSALVKVGFKRSIICHYSGQYVISVGQQQNKSINNTQEKLSTSVMIFHIVPCFYSSMNRAAAWCVVLAFL